MYCISEVYYYYYYKIEKLSAMIHGVLPECRNQYLGKDLVTILCGEGTIPQLEQSIQLA